MTKITFYNSDENVIRGFRCENHSGYGEKGSDIVCAAVSALVINTINSIEMLTKDRPYVYNDEETAVISAEFTQDPGKEAELLLQSLVLGIQSIEENEEYAEFIDLIFEEV